MPPTTKEEELIDRVVEFVLGHTELYAVKESEYFSDDMIAYEDLYFIKIIPKETNWRYSEKRVQIWKKFAKDTCIRID